MDRAELAELLAAYRPTDTGERLAVQRMQRLLMAASPFARSNFAPGHFTASAFVLHPRKHALLLIFHRKLELWLQPGGHVDPTDPNLLASARRELCEEVGLKDLDLHGHGIFDVDIHPIPATKTESAHEHFDVRFAFRAHSFDLYPNAEVAGARWVALDDLLRITQDASVLRAAAKLGAAP